MFRNFKKYAFLIACLAMLSIYAEEQKLTPAEINQKAELRMQNFTKPAGMQIKLWADETQTTNPSAIYFDSQGLLYKYSAPVDAGRYRWRIYV